MLWRNKMFVSNTQLGTTFLEDSWWRPWCVHIFRWAGDTETSTRDWRHRSIFSWGPSSPCCWRTKRNRHLYRYDQSSQAASPSWDTHGSACWQFEQRRILKHNYKLPTCTLSWSADQKMDCPRREWHDLICNQDSLTFSWMCLLMVEYQYQIRFQHLHMSFPKLSATNTIAFPKSPRKKNTHTEKIILMSLWLFNCTNCTSHGMCSLSSSPGLWIWEAREG